MNTPLVLAALSFLTSLWLPAAWGDNSCAAILMADLDARQFYAAGDKMSARVSAPADPNPLPGLDRKILSDFVEVRLRSLGLFDKTSEQHLHVTVQVAEADYIILMALRREVDDLGYGMPGVMTVWYAASTGQHVGSTGGVLAEVGRRVFLFAEQYKAAQRACGEET